MQLPPMPGQQYLQTSPHGGAPSGLRENGTYSSTNPSENNQIQHFVEELKKAKLIIKELKTENVLLKEKVKFLQQEVTE